MTKFEAIEELIREAWKERTTKVGRKRVEKACAVLDLRIDDTVRVLRLLEYIPTMGNQHHERKGGARQ